MTPGAWMRAGLLLAAYGAHKAITGHRCWTARQDTLEDLRQALTMLDAATTTQTGHQALDAAIDIIDEAIEDAS